MLAPATIPAPEMVGLLVWWSVVLAAPVVALRRRRRRGAASHPSRRSVLRRPRDTPRWRTAEPSSEQRTAPGPASLAPDEPVELRSVTEAASGADRSRAGASCRATTPAAGVAKGTFFPNGLNGKITVTQS